MSKDNQLLDDLLVPHQDFIVQTTAIELLQIEHFEAMGPAPMPQFEMPQLINFEMPQQDLNGVINIIFDVFEQGLDVTIIGYSSTGC